MASWYSRGYSVGRRSRWTVILAVAAFFIGAGATFYWHSEVFSALLAPADGRLSPFDGKPVFNAPTSMFGSTLGLSVNGGKLFAYPVVIVGVLWQLRPLVPTNWWRFMTVYTVLSIGMFTLGDAFVYFVMMPVSLNFLLTFGADIAVPLILLDEYMGLLFSLFMWIGLIFLLPIIMNLLARFGVLSYKRARSVHRVGIPTIIFFSAMISPGLDGLLTALVAASMYSLYLVGLGAVWITNPQEGNYLYFWTISGWIRSVRNGITWFLMRPVVAVHKVHYKFRDNNKRF